MSNHDRMETDCYMDKLENERLTHARTHTYQHLIIKPFVAKQPAIDREHRQMTCPVSVVNKYQAIARQFQQPRSDALSGTP